MLNRQSGSDVKMEISSFIAAIPINVAHFSQYVFLPASPLFGMLPFIFPPSAPACSTSSLFNSLLFFRHFSGRVFISLGDGHIVVFRRQTHRPEAISGDQTPPPPHTSSPIPDNDIRISSTSQNYLSISEELAEAVTAAGAWDLSEAVVIRCAPSAQYPVKSLTVVPPALTIWAGIRNRVLVIDTTTFQRLYAYVLPIISTVHTSSNKRPVSASKSVCQCESSLHQI